MAIAATAANTHVPGSGTVSSTACWTPSGLRAVAAIRPVSLIELAVVIVQPLSDGASSEVRLCMLAVAMS